MGEAGVAPARPTTPLQFADESEQRIVLPAGASILDEESKEGLSDYVCKRGGMTVRVRGARARKDHVRDQE